MAVLRGTILSPSAVTATWCCVVAWHLLTTQPVEAAEPPQLACPPKETIQQELITRLDALRAQARRCGTENHPAAPSVNWDHRLYQAAQAHADDMLRRRYFAHNPPEGWTPGMRADRAGYAWAQLGENIGMGADSVAAILEAWRNSPAHCRTMMHGDFRDVALACARGEDVLYWVLQLGRTR